jgi:hypothetical protein
VAVLDAIADWRRPARQRPSPESCASILRSPSFLPMMVARMATTISTSRAPPIRLVQVFMLASLDEFVAEAI